MKTVCWGEALSWHVSVCVAAVLWVVYVWAGRVGLPCSLRGVLSPSLACGPVVVAVLLGRVVCLEGERPATSLGVVGLCVVLYMLWLGRFGFGGRMCPCVLSCAVLWGAPVVFGVFTVGEGFVALFR